MRQSWTDREAPGRPGGNLQNTRDVASPSTSTNVSKLGVAWTGPIRPDISHLDYATTPVVVSGVVCTQDMKSDVLAIELATGKVLWTHTYNSPSGGPDVVNVAGGTVYVSTVPDLPVPISEKGLAESSPLWRRHGHQ